MGYGDEFILTLFTNDAALASRADAAGVDRIGLDLEKIGKQERQAGLKTWISDHEERHLPAIRSALKRARLFARTNPIHSGSKGEIDRLIDKGVEDLMLPMFRTAEEVSAFIHWVGGRARVSLLLETAQAMVRIHEIVNVGAVDEIFIGLNDLHLSLGLKNHFELLCSGVMDMLSRAVLDAGFRFGFGGIGRPCDASLPIPSDCVYAQYPRLKATSALVSRVFFNIDDGRLNLSHEISEFRRRMTYWGDRPPAELKSAVELLQMKAKDWKK